MWLLCLLSTLSAAAYTDHRYTKVDSVEALLNSKTPPKGNDLMSCYMELIRGYLGKDTRMHNDYCRKALALSYQLDSKNARERALYHLGLQYYGQDRWKEAEQYFKWALALTDSMVNDKRYTASTIDDNRSQIYGALGNLYNIQDQALMAIEWYQKALTIFEKNGWLQSQCILHHNSAELWLSMGNDEKAEQEYLLAIEKGTQSGDSLMMFLPRKGLVKIYIGKGLYDKAKETLLPAYRYYHAHSYEETNDYPETLSSMVKMNLMEGHENLNLAKKYAHEALSLINDRVGTETRCDVYGAAAMVAMKEKRWQQALDYALKSIHENDSEATYSDADGYETLANIYTQLGDKEKACLYIKKVRTTMERFATEHYQSALSQTEVLYETKKKESEIQQLTREKRWFLWGGILTTLVLLLTATTFFLLWRGLKLKRKTALIQAKLNGEIGERVRLARDLHDRLGGVLTSIKHTLSPDSNGAKLTDDAIREMRNISHHLLPDSLSRYGLRTALRDYCRTLKNVKFSFSGEEQRLDKMYEEVIYCIVYELVNNAVKSANAEHIFVQLIADEDYTAINVSDDGNGRLSTDECNSGCGLRNIRERVDAIGGKLDIYSKPGEGTEINIEIQTCKNPQLGGC